MNKRAFTLIELLVVIAIIAILTAILFPVFAQAREQARSTQCLSNIKQIGMALLSYISDYDDFYPVAPVENNILTIDDSENYVGHTRLTESNAETFKIYSHRNQIEPYVKNGAVFVCPSDTANVGDYVPGKRFTSYHYRYYIGVKPFLTYNLVVPDGKFANWPTIWSEGTIEHPAQTFTFSEMQPFHKRDKTNIIMSLNPEDTRGYGDNARFNLVFADGHAKSYTASQSFFWQEGMQQWDYHWPKHHDGIEIEVSYPDSLWDVE